MNTDIRITETISINFVNVKLVNLEIATAIPFLALFMANKVMKLPIKLTELIALFKTKKSLLSIFLIIEEVKTDVCDVPKPGRKAEKIPAIKPIRTYFNFLKSILKHDFV